MAKTTPIPDTSILRDAIAAGCPTEEAEEGIDTIYHLVKKLDHEHSPAGGELVRLAKRNEELTDAYLADLLEAATTGEDLQKAYRLLDHALWGWFNEKGWL